MNKPPEWPYRCPRDGKYLSNVDAIFVDEINSSIRDREDPDVPVLVYGTCKLHGRVWLSDHASYQPHLWRRKHELRTLERAERSTPV